MSIKFPKNCSRIHPKTSFHLAATMRKRRTSTWSKKQIKLRCHDGECQRCFMSQTLFFSTTKKKWATKTIKMHRNTRAKFVELDWLNRLSRKKKSYLFLFCCVCFFLARNERRTHRSPPRIMTLLSICHLALAMLFFPRVGIRYIRVWLQIPKKTNFKSHA